MAPRKSKNIKIDLRVTEKDLEFIEDLQESRKFNRTQAILYLLRKGWVCDQVNCPHQQLTIPDEIKVERVDDGHLHFRIPSSMNAKRVTFEIS